MYASEPVKIELSSQLLTEFEQSPQASALRFGPPPGLDEPATVSLESALPVTSLAQIQALQLEHAALQWQNALLRSASNSFGKDLQSIPRPGSPASEGKAGCDSESTASGDAEELSSEDEELTTVIVKKLPKAFTSFMLVELLNSTGFKGCFDFLYLPINFDKMVGTGCAFINFRSTNDATRFMTQFQGFSRWGVPGQASKHAEIMWSSGCQGRLPHVERYRDSPVMHPSVPSDCKPMLFDSQGNLETFPAARKPLQPPRMRGLPSTAENE